MKILTKHKMIPMISTLIKYQKEKKDQYLTFYFKKERQFENEYIKILPCDILKIKCTMLNQEILQLNDTKPQIN